MKNLKTLSKTLLRRFSLQKFISVFVVLNNNCRLVAIFRSFILLLIHFLSYTQFFHTINPPISFDYMFNNIL